MTIPHQAGYPNRGCGLCRAVAHATLLVLVGSVLVMSYPQLTGHVQPMADAGNDVRHASVVSGRGASLSAFVNDANASTDEATDAVGQGLPATVVSGATVAGDLFKLPLAQTIIPKRPRKELVLYTVQAGDNLSTIAERYDVDIDTLIWANDKLEEDPDYLTIGQQLVIPPVSGVLYTAKDGDTVADIAKKFKGDVRTISELEYNKLVAPSMNVISGTKIMIPGGEKPYQPRLVYIGGNAVMVNAPRGGGRFVWPTTGYISTYFSAGGHRGIDIAGPPGTPVYAADAGVVILAGWDGGYGNCIIIDHGNGFQTLYAHLAAFYPQTGSNVRRGQAIGKMGSTGNSTGPHLHFEVLYGGGLVNPLKYLPQ